MTYLEALNLLGKARRFGMKLGLENMRALAEGLGNPQEALKFIHLAGTNGKGSTAAFIESGLRSAGFRTALFTSPHLVSPLERVQVNREPISREEFARGIEAVFRASELKGIETTFFEIVTGLALWYFGQKEVDWVVWETGLGGRLDATNIVFPEVAVITSIGLDHQKWLGNTLSEIAREKAGILKGRNVAGKEMRLVCGERPGDAGKVISEVAAGLGIESKFVCEDGALALTDLGLRGGVQFVSWAGEECALGLIGPHQIRNAACAVAALEFVGVARPAIKSGLEKAMWAGRFDVLSREPLIVLDGAHNCAGAAELAKTWSSFLSSTYGWAEEQVLGRAHLVFSAVVDKDIAGMIRLLRPLAGRVSLVQMNNERSASLDFLNELFAGLPMTHYGSVNEFWNELMADSKNDPTLIAGSLFLVGEVLAVQRGLVDEYQMNELLEESGKGK
jgi:dihydrofolate synthase/folylpolyglutamate synthase